MDELSVIALVAPLCGLLALALLAKQDRRPTLLLLGILGLFAAGEMLLLSRQVVVGTLLFVAGGVLFLLRERLHRPEPEEQDSSPRPYGRWLLLLLLVLVLGTAAGLRFWRVGDVPYGIEQDEMSWTVAAAHVTYTDISIRQASEQRNYLPVSSFQERIFFDLFGMSIRSARLEVAFFSTLAVALFYLLVRQFTNRPTALIATFFLAISTLHVAAARQANVESHILFWVVLSYLLFWLAVRNRSLLLFFGTGVSVVLGLWTYDTYNLTAAVIGAALALFAVMDLRRWRFHALSAVAFLLPIALVAENEFTYLDSRRGYTFRNFDALRESLDGPIWERAWDYLTYFGDNLTVLAENLFVGQTRQEYQFLLVRPDGPVVLAAVLPLAALGLLLVLRAPRRREHLFLLLWLPLQLLAVPMVLGTEFGRVLLPGTLVLYVLAGMGGWSVLRHVLSGATSGQGVAVVGSTLLAGAVLVGVGTNMYFSEVQDPDDRRMRRELVDLVTTQRDISSYIMIPITPGQGDYLASQRYEIRFAVAKPPDLEAADSRFTYVRFDSLVEQVTRYASGPKASEPLLILLEHRNPDPLVPVRPAVEAVRRCYDMDPVRRGTYFDMFHIPKESLLNPRCGT